MKKTYQKTYHGLAHIPITWKALEEIFDSLWKGDYHALPKYPKILGGIKVAWTDGSNNPIEADVLDDLKQAYSNYETKEIVISGNPKHAPYCAVTYIPSRSDIQAVIQKTSESETEAILQVIKNYFPKEIKHNYWLQNTQFFYQNKGKIIVAVFSTSRKDKKDKTNYILFIFTILYEQHIKNSKVEVPDKTIRSNLIKDFGLSSDVLSRQDFLKTTVGHSRKKFKDSNLEDFVFIKRQNKGYILIIKE